MTHPLAIAKLCPRRLAGAKPMDASVDGVRVSNGLDVGQTFSHVNGDVLASRRTVPGPVGCEPVRGFDRHVGVVLPAVKQDRRR